GAGDHRHAPEAAHEALEVEHVGRLAGTREGRGFRLARCARRSLEGHRRNSSDPTHAGRPPLGCGTPHPFAPSLARPGGPWPGAPRLVGARRRRIVRAMPKRCGGPLAAVTLATLLAACGSMRDRAAAPRPTPAGAPVSHLEERALLLLLVDRQIFE